MTDYLEALIEDQEPESPEHMLSWGKARFLPVESPAAEKRDVFADGNPTVQGTQLPAEANTLSQVYADRVRKRSGLVSTPEASTQPTGFTSPVAAWSPEWTLRKLRRAVRAQNVLKPILMPHSAAAAFFGPGGFTGGPASARSDSAGQAALMDTLFARDARRYDGPLRLL